MASLKKLHINNGNKANKPNRQEKLDQMQAKKQPSLKIRPDFRLH
jgi:hypothetical protein